MLGRKENGFHIRDKLLDTFKDLQFDEPTHVYTLRGKNPPSVSSLIKNFYVEFDSKYIGLKYAKSRGFKPEQVWDAWTGEGDIASHKGHRVHKFSEDYCRWKYFGEGVEPTVSCKQCLGVLQFWNSLPDYLIPVAFELMMYNEELGYCGTADIIVWNTRTNKLVVLDWKTNNELFDDNQQFMKHLSSSNLIRQDNFGKYTIQFSMYQILLQKAGFEVGGRVLIWLNEDKPNKKLYKTFQTQDLTEELLTLKHIWTPNFKT